MTSIDKAVELLEKVLKENYKLIEGYEIKPETRDEIEDWLKWYNDLQKRADGISLNDDSGLTIPVVSNSVCQHDKKTSDCSLYKIHKLGCKRCMWRIKTDC